METKILNLHTADLFALSANIQDLALKLNTLRKTIDNGTASDETLKEISAIHKELSQDSFDIGRYAKDIFYALDTMRENNFLVKNPSTKKTVEERRGKRETIIIG